MRIQFSRYQCTLSGNSLLQCYKIIDGKNRRKKIHYYNVKSSDCQKQIANITKKNLENRKIPLENYTSDKHFDNFNNLYPTHYRLFIIINYLIIKLLDKLFNVISRKFRSLLPFNVILKFSSPCHL